MCDKPDAIGTLPNGESIYPEEGLELDSPQAVEEYVNEKVEEFNITHVKCHHCGEWIMKAEALLDSDGNEYCSSCYEEHTYICHDCGCVKYESKCTTIGVFWFCDVCSDEWAECRDCGGVFRKNDMQEYRNSYICEACYDNYYHRCCRCNRVVHEDNVNFVGGRAYCSDCCPDEDNIEGLLEYHGFEEHGGLYDPRRVNAYDNEERMLFGVELECDCGSFDYDRFRTWTDDDFLVHFEEDGSLSNSGVECVTQPCSLRFHQERMDWKRLCECLIAQDFRSHDTESCGLHVHMSRSRLTPLQIIKMDVFINRGIEFWCQIGRRREIYSGSYDRNKVAKRSKAYQGTGMSYKFGRCDDDRYVPVNTSNSRTVELRFCRGTLNPETILGTLECFHALPKFLDTVSITQIYNTDKNVIDFIKFMFANVDKYPNAANMMSRLVTGKYSELVGKLYHKMNHPKVYGEV